MLVQKTKEMYKRIFDFGGFSENPGDYWWAFLGRFLLGLVITIGLVVLFVLDVAFVHKHALFAVFAIVTVLCLIAALIFLIVTCIADIALTVRRLRSVGLPLWLNVLLVICSYLFSPVEIVIWVLASLQKNSLGDNHDDTVDIDAPVSINTDENGNVVSKSVTFSASKQNEDNN